MENDKKNKFEKENNIVPEVQNVEISNQVQNSFLDYAMSVIISRAIPNVCDGLKPVHRRIIYSMYESGNTPDKSHKKSARVVGDVMGKYHPHGDDAIYSSIARLAQPFSMRYPLVDGHGNFGSIDGDEPAASRYTEVRLEKLALQMVRDIDCSVVDFVDNYDGLDKEPTVLPSRFPNLLVNGSSGIAVGMATNIPPHNLGEVIDATIAIAKNPNLTPEDIMQIISGPDFPTGGIILGRQGIKKAYETGNGSIVIRAKTHFEETSSNKKKNIIVDEIPYGVNKSHLIETIASLVREKNIEGITEIRDESNKEGIRVVIGVRHDCVPQIILNHLYKKTQLQLSFGIIFLCLENNIPKVLPINAILNDYVEYQINIITKRTNFLLKKDQDRKHIVLGLLIAIESIDDVVKIIKKSSTLEEATKKLMDIYKLTEIQTQAVLSMTLRRLTGLEKNKLDDEIKELDLRMAKYEHILKNRDNKIDVVINELTEIKEKFSDKRRTTISDDVVDISDELLIPKESIVVFITHNGYIKRTTVDTFRTQNRGGRGVKGTVLGDNDLIRNFIYTNTHVNLFFFSNKGKVYRLKGYKIPDGSRISKGIPVQNLLNLEENEKIMSIIDLYSEHQQEGFLTFFTRNGLVKRTPIKEYLKINRNGKKAVKLREGDQLIDVKHTSGNCLIVISSANGKLVKFKESDIRIVGRVSFGVKGINVKGTYVASANTSLEGDIVLSITKNGYGKITKLDKYRLTRRGAKGVTTVNVTKKTGCLIATKIVKHDDGLMVVTTNGILIRLLISNMKLIGRNTQGVRLIRLEEKDFVSSLTIIPSVSDNKSDNKNQN